MWLLECEGEVLGGKKLWLKPGNKYVLGRVPSPEGMVLPRARGQEGERVADIYGNSEFADAFAEINIESSFDHRSWGGYGRRRGRSSLIQNRKVVLLITSSSKLKLHCRSTVTVTDYKTKHGTRLDGDEIRDQTILLDGGEHSFHLGKYELGFRLVERSLPST